MSTRAKFMSGFSWSTATVVFQTVVQVIYAALLARLIDEESFTLMGIVLTLMGFAEIFSQIGIGPALIQRKSLDQSHVNAAFYSSVLLGVMFTVAFILAASYIAREYKMPDLELIIQVVCTSFTISALGVVPRSLMTKEMDFKSFFKAGAISIVGGNLVVGLLLAYLDFNVWAYVWALFAQNTLMVMALWYYQPTKISFNWSWPATKDLIGYGGWSTMFNSLNYAATRVDVTLIPKLNAHPVNGPSSEQLRQGGLYERSAYLMSLPITIMAKLSDSVLFSGMSKMQDENDRLRRMILLATNAIAVTVMPGVIFICVFSHEIMVTFLGEKYTEAGPIVQILFLAVIWRTLSRLGDSLLRAKDEVKRGTIIKAIYVAIMFIGVWFTVPFGMQWVAWSIVVTTFIHYLMSSALCRRLIGVSLASQIRALVPGILLSAVSAVAAFGMHVFVGDWSPVIALTVGAGGWLVVIAAAVYLFPGFLGTKRLNILGLLPQRLLQLPVIRNVYGRYRSWHQ